MSPESRRIDDPAGGSGPVLALIPAYNEAERIGGVITATRERLPVLVVDDGSTDDTASLAEGAGATVLRQQPNQGKGAALRAGFRWALEQGYAAVITLDADGQHDPAEIPAFLEAYTTHQADLVIGERDFTQMPFPRNLSNTVGRWLFSWALGQRVQDNQSGYRLLSRRMMEATLASRESGFEFEVDMIVQCVRHGYRMVGVPIRTIYAGETSHIKPIHQTVHFLRVVWHTWRTMRRSRRGYRRVWLLLPVLAILIAVLLVLRATDESPTATPAYPTPPPVTFVPPTPLPVAARSPVALLGDPLIGEPVPDVTVTTLEGAPLRLRDLDGSIVLLNFWASWCVPCQHEMPLLQAIQDEKAAADVRVVAVTNPDDGQTEADIRAFLDRFDLSLTVALSTDETFFRRFEVEQIPLTFIIDRAGIVRFRHIGELTEAEAAAYLAQLGVE